MNKDGSLEKMSEVVCEMYDMIEKEIGMDIDKYLLLCGIDMEEGTMRVCNLFNAKKRLADGGT